MCGDGRAAPRVPRSVAEALRMARSAAGYLNAPGAAGLEGSACGEALVALGEIQAKLAAAQAEFLRRFDAADAHDADGYGSSSAWLAARARLSRKDARAAVREMRVLGGRPLLCAALAAGDISKSWANAIAGWTGKLPEAMRQETDKIILGAAAAGADLDDLAVIAGLAIEKWRQQQPGEDGDEDRFRDRSLTLATTFGGAAVLRGDLSPECAAAVTAVLESLGKKRGKEDGRTREQRWHDGLQEACQRLIRAKLVPDRAGADTQAVVHIPISQLRQMPGAPEAEDAWLRAKLGEPGYLVGTDAETAACDAMTVPVVTGHADMTVIDQIIDLAAAAHGTPAARIPGAGPFAHTARTAEGARAAQADSAAWYEMSPGARQAHRYAIARLAVEFVSGPGGLASALRTGLLQPPCNTPSLPLDIGAADSIPGHIRRAVTLRDQHCAWPGGCDRPPSACDVHHITHQQHGGETSAGNCLLLCNYHHDICIHRHGWQIILHPDGTVQATSPDGSQTLRKHQPFTTPDG